MSALQVTRAHLSSARPSLEAGRSQRIGISLTARGAINRPAPPRSAAGSVLDHGRLITWHLGGKRHCRDLLVVAHLDPCKEVLAIGDGRRNFGKVIAREGPFLGITAAGARTLRENPALCSKVIFAGAMA
jgi:hypothetical protein